MGCREEIFEVAESRGWARTESSERSGTLGALDEYRRDGNAVRVFFGARGGIRTAWVHEGNRDPFRIAGQGKCQRVIRYLKTGFLP